MNDMNIPSAKAMAFLKNQGNTDVLEVLTQPLYDTKTLSTGASSRISFFTQSRQESGGDAAVTNNPQGGRIPAKQFREWDGLKIEVVTPTPLADADIAVLSEYLYNSVITFSKDGYEKLVVPVTTVMGTSALVQGAAAVGTNSLAGGVFHGIMSIRNTFLMGAESTFEVVFENKIDATVPAALNGVKIRIEWLGDFVRLVA